MPQKNNSDRQAQSSGASNTAAAAPVPPPTQPLPPPQNSEDVDGLVTPFIPEIDGTSVRTTVTSPGGVDMKRDNSALTTKDLELTMQTTQPSRSDLPAELQSLVTQVRREDVQRRERESENTTNGRGYHSIARTTTQDEIPPFNLHTDNRPHGPSPTSGSEPNRSLLSRLFCCFPKASSGTDRQAGMVVPSNTSSFYLGGKKSSFGSFRSSSQNQHQLASTSYESSLSLTGGPSIPLGINNQSNRGKKYLALDLDETLVHSSFQPVDNASFVISVVIEAVVHNVFVIKRPGVDQFLQRLSKHYELIIYTASLSKYADPLLDILDPHKTISKRLFRENCVFYDGHYVKDLSVLDKDISQSIIVDNSPMSYIFHPENAIDCTSFFDDPSDVEMWEIADFLEHIRNCDDVRAYCKHWREWCRNNPNSSVPDYMRR